MEKKKQRRKFLLTSVLILIGLYECRIEIEADVSFQIKNLLISFSHEMADNEDQENFTSSSDDDDDDSTSSSSSTSTDDDDEQVDDESDDNLSSLTSKQAYLFLENKRKTLGKRLLELRDELKAQPQANIDTKKRLLTEIKNLREKWIAVQTRLTNVKARLSHSPTPERKIVQKTSVKKPVKEVVQPETRIIPPPRIRTTTYSSSSRSRSSSRDSR
jgi:hypothetical protein